MTITVDGQETELFALTDPMGNFRLEPAPVGRFFVHINGQTATNAVPPGAYYPFVGKAWESVASQETNIGNVFLPLVAADTLQAVSQTQDTEITFPSEVLKQNPELAGVSIMVPADSLFANDGTRGGMVGIAPVAPDRLPGQLPSGLELPLVITVQTSGATNFDVPVPVCFPNLPDPVTGAPLDPGTENALLSFNHDTGRWEHVGPMTVSDDGQLICTDPGVGIRAPGWHGSGPAPVEPPPPPDPPQCGGTAAVGTTAGDGDCCVPDQTAFIACFDDRTHELRGRVAACTLLAVGCVALCVAATGPVATAACWGCVGVLTACEAGAICENEYQQCVCTRDHQCGPRCASSCGDGAAAASANLGVDVPVLTELLRINNQAISLLYPLMGMEIPGEVPDQVQALLDEADTVAGGDAVQWLSEFIVQQEELSAPLKAQIGEPAGLAPPHSVSYEAEIERPDGILRLRGKTDPLAQYAIFVPRDGQLRSVNFFDPMESTLGVAFPRLSAQARYDLQRVYMLQVGESDLDFDSDGLVDLAEVVLGTLPWNSDTDGDGIPDGAEVQQGTDPLDGVVAQTGIIATVNTTGTAVDVCAVNDVAVVADSGAGVTIFNVFNGMEPTIIAQVDTPGSASAVACAGDLIPVADGDAGLAIIDISDPPAAQIIHQIPLGGAVRAVVAGGPIAYVGVDDGTIAAIDLATGAVLQQTNVGSAVQDLAIEKETLYVLTVGTLHALPLTGGPLQVAGSVASPGVVGAAAGRLRLFVGGGIAYAVHTVGYNTFDLASPLAPSLIATGSTTQFGWKQVTPNGSGLAVATVGNNSTVDGPHHVSLYDVSDPAQTDVFLTTFPTPGLARSVSIFNGLAYVADGSAGLQVINYLAYDALGVPPAITVASNFAPGMAEEGQIMRVTADVTDDVQVRHVEFYVDGVKVFTDGNFPFEHRFVTPVIAQQSSFTLRARASDTGGNATWTDETVITLVPDATPPSVVAFSPPDGSDECPNSVTAVSVTFSEPIDLATLDESTFQLFSAGGDGIPGNGDDVSVVGAISFLVESNTALLSFFGAALPADSYHAVAGGSIADLAGNVLGADLSWTFGVLAPAVGCCQAGCPGCTDAVVEACVCAQAPSCCTNNWDELCVVLVEFLGCGTCDGSGLIAEAVGSPIGIENLTDPTGPAINEAVGPPVALQNLTDPTGPPIGEAVGPAVSLENLGTPP